MGRKDISMTPEEIAAFLDEGRVLQVATIGRDGRPHLAPMWYAVEDGKVAFRSFTKSQKIINLKRDPRLTVLLEDGDGYAVLRGLMIKGRARLIADPDHVLDLYRKLAARYSFSRMRPVEMDREALEATFGKFASKNTAVVVDPESIVSWDHRKLGGAY